jgi:inhibitor of cysteine peptidase
MTKMICLTLYLAWNLLPVFADPSQKINTNAKFLLSNNKKPIVLTQNHVKFSVILKSNPTTGYRWFLMLFDSSMVEPLKKVYHPPVEVMEKDAAQSPVGQTGYDEWRFRLRKTMINVPRVTTLVFCYMRPWMAICDQHKTFTVVWYE